MFPEPLVGRFAALVERGAAKGLEGLLGATETRDGQHIQELSNVLIAVCHLRLTCFMRVASGKTQEL